MSFGGVYGTYGVIIPWDGSPHCSGRHEPRPGVNSHISPPQVGSPISCKARPHRVHGVLGKSPRGAAAAGASSCRPGRRWRQPRAPPRAPSHNLHAKQNTTRQAGLCCSSQPWQSPALDWQQPGQLLAPQGNLRHALRSVVGAAGRQAGRRAGRRAGKQAAGVRHAPPRCGCRSWQCV